MLADGDEGVGAHEIVYEDGEEGYDVYQGNYVRGLPPDRAAKVPTREKAKWDEF